MSMGCLEATGTTCILALQGLLFFYFFFLVLFVRHFQGLGRITSEMQACHCVINLRVCVGFCTFMGKKKSLLKIGKRFKVDASVSTCNITILNR